MKYLSVLLFLFSCNSSVFVTKKKEFWKVLQIGGTKFHSSFLYYKINNNGTFDELFYEKGGYKKFKSNPDVEGYETWNFLNDSCLIFSGIKYKVKVLNDSVCFAINETFITDTMILLKEKVRE